MELLFLPLLSLLFAGVTVIVAVVTSSAPIFVKHPTPPLALRLLPRQNFQSGFAPKEAWSWGALSERFGNSTVRVSLSETGRYSTTGSATRATIGVYT